MGAISLYRGNLHRVPDATRRWLMPTPNISIKDFKSLLNRRSKALSRLRSITTTATATATTSNANPSPDSKDKGTLIEPKLEPEKVINREEEEGTSTKGGASSEINGKGGLDSCNYSIKQGNGCILLPDGKPVMAEKGAEAGNGDVNLQGEKPDETANPNTETTSKTDVFNEKGKRRREVEEKLEVLNAKKHNLVQVLKQILNGEEELKRRNSTQGMAIRPSIPLQVDMTNDSGSMSRHVTPRSGSEANLSVDMEGGEAEDDSNHNIHSRNIHQISSISPSSESPLRRPPPIQHNAAPHPSRSSLGTTGSPSRFAPTGHQAQPANLPTVSVSGTNYIASSPSPAASGGTSAFRDARQPSPWN